MIRITNNLPGVFLLLLILLGLVAEGDIQKRVIDKLEIYNREFPQEKVYLHLDKPYYHPRDTVWFKGYLVDAINHFPDVASGVLYVDLIDEKKGKLLLAQTIRVDSGFAQGHIDLPDSLIDGQYQVRAYTNWMRNFPESNFFTREIRIYKDIDRSYDDEKMAKLTTVSDLQFFPEGGDLVQGLRSRVAFKAVNGFGHGVDTKGYVLNSKHDTVAAFQSSHQGMGYFLLEPSANENYVGFVRNVKGVVSESFPLSPILSLGFVMTVDNITGKDEIRVNISHNYPAKQNVTLIAHQHGKVRYAADVLEAGRASLLRVPRKYFTQDGIIHFTLFNPEGTPLCERLAYINTEQPLKVQFTTNKETYLPREKVKAEIQVTDFSGNPVAGNFSLAVTDETQIIPEVYGENIMTSLLLDSEVSQRAITGYNPQIRGIIEQPGWYFDPINEGRKVYLDMLLMTQGWRRFTWSDILDKPARDTTHSIETGLDLSGSAVLRNGAPLPVPTVLTFIITSVSGRSEFIQAIPNEKGKFKLKDLDFTGRSIITAARMEKEKKLQYTIDSVSSRQEVSKHTDVAPVPWITNEALTNFLTGERKSAEADFLRNQMLQEVVVKASRIVADDPRKRMLPTAMAVRVVKVDVTMCGGVFNVLQILQSRVPSLKVVSDGFGGYKATFRNGSVGYILDGFPVDISTINTLIPCDIESIEIFGPMAIWGSLNMNTIAMYTRPFSATEAARDSRYTQFIRNGYSVYRQFYSPNYDVNPNSTIPDFRSTIYWQPNVVTDRNGNAKIEFWNSDESNTRIRASIEGMNFQGKLVAASKSYMVK